jgi:hypothetical protein
MGAGGNTCASRGNYTLIWKGDMDKNIHSNILLIAGTGQNSGKTTLACQIIQKFSKIHPVIALKISSHFHINVESGNIIINNDDIYFAEETDASKPKDSSRMLAAGARKSYFIMATDENITDAMQQFFLLVNPDDLIVCESGGLRNIIKPGLFFIMHFSGNESPKQKTLTLKPLCDKWITFNGSSIDFFIDSIEVTQNTWQLK